MTTDTDAAVCRDWADHIAMLEEYSQLDGADSQKFNLPDSVADALCMVEQVTAQLLNLDEELPQ